MVPRGYSTGPGQIVPRLFSRTWLNGYNALIGYLTGPKIFTLKYLRNFYLFSFIWYLCIVFKSVYIHFFFLYMICFCAVLGNMVCACVKTWITYWSWSVLLATDSNSTVLHFDSLNKPDLSWPCGTVAVQSLTKSLSKIQWAPLFRYLHAIMLYIPWEISTHTQRVSQ